MKNQGKIGKTRKKFKMNWGRLLLVLIFIASCLYILRDMYLLTIHSWVTGQLVSWTWFGLYTFFIAFFIAGGIYIHFVEVMEEQEMKKARKRNRCV